MAKTNNVLCSGGGGGAPSSVSGVLPDGNIIGIHDDGQGNTTTIRETATSFTLDPDTCKATFINESGVSTIFDYQKQYERFTLPAQVVTNTGAVLNTIVYNAGDFGSLIASSGDSVRFPKDGEYEVSLVADYFDNNSARVAHRAIFYINGVEYSRLSGANYLRDVQIDLQTTSSLVGTTDLTEDSRLLIRQL